MEIMNNYVDNVPSYALYIGIFAICFALFQSKKVKSIKVDNKKMEEIAGHLRDGAMMFLKREYSLLIWFVLFVVVVVSFTALCVEHILYGRSCKKLID